MYKIKCTEEEMFRLVYAEESPTPEQVKCSMAEDGLTFENFFQNLEFEKIPIGELDFFQTITIKENEVMYSADALDGRIDWNFTPELAEQVFEEIV